VASQRPRPPGTGATSVLCSQHAGRAPPWPRHQLGAAAARIMGLLCRQHRCCLPLARCLSALALAL
jgi:hypothetical protein